MLGDNNLSAALSFLEEGQDANVHTGRRSCISSRCEKPDCSVIKPKERLAWFCLSPPHPDGNLGQKIPTGVTCHRGRGKLGSVCLQEGCRLVPPSVAGVEAIRKIPLALWDPPREKGSSFYLHTHLRKGGGNCLPSPSPETPGSSSASASTCLWSSLLLYLSLTAPAPLRRLLHVSVKPGRKAPPTVLA